MAAKEATEAGEARWAVMEAVAREAKSPNSSKSPKSPCENHNLVDRSDSRRAHAHLTKEDDAAQERE